MKIALMSAASAIFIFGSGFASAAREVITFHGAGVIAERRAEHRDYAALEDGVLCTVEYIPTRDDMGWYNRESVDCEE
jgi:hypothetical protein